MPPSQKPGKEPDTSEGEWIHPYIHKSEKKGDGSDNLYEKCFDLIKDECLLKANVKICAVTEVKAGSFQNKIRFKRENEISPALGIQLVLDSESKEFMKEITTDDNLELKMISTALEIYLTLKNFVLKIVEIGLFKSLDDSTSSYWSYNAVRLENLQGGIINALFKIAPDETKDIVIKLLERKLQGEKSTWTGSPAWWKVNERILPVIEKLPMELVQLLALSANWKVRTCMVMREDLSDEVIRKLVHDQSSAVRRQVAERNNLSEDLIRILARDKHWFVRKTIAMRKDLPNDLDFRLKKEVHFFSIEELTQTYDVLDNRDRDPDCPAYLKPAYLYSLSSKELHILAEDECPAIRVAIAFRRDLDDSLFQLLAADDDPAVRKALLLWDDDAGMYFHEKIPEDVYRKLALDKEDSIRALVVKRHDLPEDLVESLARDKSLEVRLEVIGYGESRIHGISFRISELPETIKGIFLKDIELLKILLAIPQHARLPSWLSLEEIPLPIVRNLVKTEGSRAPWRLACIKDLPPDLIRALAKNRAWEAREAIAERLDLPDDLVLKLGCDRAREVSWNIWKKDNLSNRMIRKLSSNRQAIKNLYKVDASYLGEQEKNLLKNRREEIEKVHKEIANEVNVSENLLILLADYGSDFIRMKIADREDLPLSVLQKLYHDDNEEVRDIITKKKLSEEIREALSWIHPLIHEDEMGEWGFFEKDFELPKDEGLFKAGVKICVQTEFGVGNRIWITRGEEEESLGCVCSAICDSILDPNAEGGFETVSIENYSDLLTVEEQYIAVKSFVGYLAENGIIQSLIESYERETKTEQDLLGFNHQLRNQLLRALQKIAYEETEEIGSLALNLILKHGCGGDLKMLESILDEFKRDFEYDKLDLNKNEILKLVSFFRGSELIDLFDILRIDLFELEMPLEWIKSYSRDGDPRIRQGFERRSVRMPPSQFSRRLKSVNLDNSRDLFESFPISKSSRDLNDKGLGFLLSGSLEKALDCFEQAIRLDPGEKVYHNNKGVTLFRLARWKEALDSYNKALQLGMWGKGILIDKALVLRKLKRFGDALDCFDEALDLGVDDNLDVTIFRRKIETLEEAGNLKWFEVELRNAASEENNNIRRIAARREEAPNDVVEMLAQDENDEVREAVAARWALPKDLVRKLARDKYVQVRLKIAARKDLPKDAMHFLARDERFAVRMTIAERNDLLEDVIQKLADDEDPKVREVIRNRHKK